MILVGRLCPQRLHIHWVVSFSNFTLNACIAKTDFKKGAYGIFCTTVVNRYFKLSVLGHFCFPTDGILQIDPVGEIGTIGKSVGAFDVSTGGSVSGGDLGGVQTGMTKVERTGVIGRKLYQYLLRPFFFGLAQIGQDLGFCFIIFMV